MEMIFWVLRKETNDQNTFLAEYNDKKSAYSMADYLNETNPDAEYWVLEINNVKNLYVGVSDVARKVVSAHIGLD